jgi:transketolase
MRKQFVSSLKNILYNDQRTVLMLGDIGVYGFREELKNLSTRAYNIGILEQSTISVAAGMSRSGLIPFIHTISPFMVERALEQIKDDFGYQNLNGNFVSIGNSYDFAALGCTHHCPGDVQVLSSIPNIKIFAPGTSSEFDYLLNKNYQNGINYYRLSEYENEVSYDTDKIAVIKEGSDATVLCIGNKLNETVSACENLNVTLLYSNTIFPFDKETLKNNFNKKIIIIQPFYVGSLDNLISEVFDDQYYRIYNIGVPRQFLTNYGTKTDHDSHLKLDFAGIREQIKIILEKI